MLRAGDGLDGVGDEFTGLQGEAHSWDEMSEGGCVGGELRERVPSPPMVMASETPTVLNCQARRPSFSRPRLTI